MAETGALAEDSGWLELIEAMESELSVLGGVLARGEDPAPDLTPWEPPAGLGQLPAALAPRVATLLADIEAATSAVTVRRDEVSRQLRAVATVPRPPAGNSVYLDVTG